MDRIYKLASMFFFLSGNIYSLIIVSAAYVYEHMDNLDDYVNSFIQVSGGLAIVGSYIGVAANAKKIKYLHSEIQKIVDGGKFIFVLNHFCF